MDDVTQDPTGPDGKVAPPPRRRPEETRTFQQDDVGAGVRAEELDEKLADEPPLAFPTSDAPGG